MSHENRFCPTFLIRYSNIVSSFLKSKDHIRKEVLNILKNRLGNLIPGFGESVLKKERIGLKAYGTGKSGGLRFVYLFLEEKGRLVSLHIYNKKGYKQEHKKLKEIKTNLKKILEELKNNECANVLPQDSNSSLQFQT